MTPTTLYPMTGHTPFALTFFQEREQSAYQAYQLSLSKLANDTNQDILPAWHDTEDQRNDWLDARRVMHKANAATPCQHTAAERSHQAQRCDWCWTISTYIRLTTPKENNND